MPFLYVLLTATLLTIRQVPADTRLHVRLTTTVGSYASSAGTRISAVLIAPVILRGETVLPAGTALTGRVRSVRRVGLGLVHETAAIGLVFDHLKLPGGEAIPISCRVEQVDNGRERVTRDGRILGERATGSLSYRTGGYIRIFLQWQVHASLAAWAIKTLLVQVPESEIYYPAGVELTLNLTNNMALNVPLQSEPATPGLAQNEREELAPLLSSMPYRTTHPASGRPADLINVLFVGSRDQLEKAFVAAGWEEARPASFRSRVRGIRAVAEGRSYRGAPMSSLFLNQTKPNMSWEKGLNDFSKRDHIRLWRQPGVWQGQDLWAGAATRDIGFAYLRYGRRITHRIEEDIDDERAKVTDDLAFTSCVDLVDWLDRPDVPRSTRNVRGDLMTTDSRLAVLRLNDCLDARMSTQTFDLEPVPRRGGILQRFARREILSVRNDLLRGNLIYRSYEGTRWVVAALVKHRQRVLAAHPVYTTPSAQPAALVSAPAS